MLSIYTSYKCKSCNKEFILLSEEIESITAGRYIACPYCNSKKVNKEKVTDDLRECMKERSYKKVKGSIRQVKYD